MNTEWFSKLMDRCKGEAWDELNNRGWQCGAGLHQLSMHQVAFIAFADQVETWIGELEAVIEQMRAGQSEDFHPQCKWTPAAWIAYYQGRLAAVDIHLNGKLSAITGWERDNIPRFATLNRLFDEAWNLCHRLSQDLGLEKPETQNRNNR